MRVLLLSSWFPHPPDNGSKIRAHHLLRALAARHHVTLLSFAESGEENDPAPLAAVCRVAAVVPRVPFRPGGARALLGYLSPDPRSVVDTYSPAMDRAVQAELRAARYDAVVALQAGAGRYLPPDARMPALLDEIETTVGLEAWTQAPAGPRRWLRRLTWAKTRRYVGRLVRRFAACTVASEQEGANLRAIVPGYEAIHLIPNGVDTLNLHPGLAEPAAGLLVHNGALTYSANLDAMQHFLVDIFPLVLRDAPEARLLMTGRTAGVDRSGLPLGDHAALTGYLPDIRPTVAGAWACVVPLRVGGGTRLKILEAMALGTPVVATSKGAEGLEVRHERDILIADGPPAFAEQTVRLLRDPDLRARLSANGRRLVEEKYSWDMIGSQFAGLVESIARPGGGSA